MEGTPLSKGKGHFLWVPRPRFNLHSRDYTTSSPSEGAFFLALEVGWERAMASAGQSVILIGCSTSKAREKRPGDEVWDSI